MKWKLNEKQLKFIQSKKRYVAYVGGRGCGKSLALVLKLIQLMLEYPKNYGLLGRYNYSDLRDTTVKDFFDVCPPSYVQSYNKQEKQVSFFNGSQLIFRGLKDIKKTEVRSLNLGFFALEQAEEIEEGLFDELSACLRRDVKDSDGKSGLQQGFFLANPALNWLWRKCKQEKRADWELVAGSTLDNAQNLPDSFIQDLLSKPDSWKRIFVYGEFDENLLAGRAVFPVEYVQEQAKNVRNYIKKLDDIEIFAEKEAGTIYQMGIDPSEGAEDSSVIKVVNCLTGEEVAKYSSHIQPDLLAFKVDKMGRYFNNAKAVLEINGIGLATLTKLKELNYESIYIREEFDKQAKVMTKKLGWRTTHASKPLLVGNFQELLNKKFIKLRDGQTVEEMKTFVYSPEAQKRGMGAERGFHDDSLIATMLAYWDVKAEKNLNEPLVIRPQESEPKTSKSYLEEIFKGFNQPRGSRWLEH